MRHLRQRVQGSYQSGPWEGFLLDSILIVRPRFSGSPLSDQGEWRSELVVLLGYHLWERALILAMAQQCRHPQDRKPRPSVASNHFAGSRQIFWEDIRDVGLKGVSEVNIPHLSISASRAPKLQPLTKSGYPRYGSTKRMRIVVQLTRQICVPCHPSLRQPGRYYLDAKLRCGCRNLGQRVE